MKHFYIVTNRLKDQDLGVTRDVVNYLEQNGCTCRTSEREVAEELCTGHASPEDVPPETECILVLGGDGSMIRAAGDLRERQIPIFGINLGTLGFLAEVGREERYAALDSLIRDRYTVEHRMMLHGEVFRNGKLIGEGDALNDIVIAREKGLKVLQLNTYVNGSFLSTYRADGMILASATGSTGYSLSAGGPIISPDADLFVMTPLCAHTISTRSIILPPENRITVEVITDKDGVELTAMAYFDGEVTVPLVTGDRVLISRAKQDTRIVKIHDSSFLETLRKKMHAI